MGSHDDGVYPLLRLEKQAVKHCTSQWIVMFAGLEEVAVAKAGI